MEKFGVSTGFPVCAPFMADIVTCSRNPIRRLYQPSSSANYRRTGGDSAFQNLMKLSIPGNSSAWEPRLSIPIVPDLSWVDCLSWAPTETGWCCVPYMPYANLTEKKQSVSVISYTRDSRFGAAQLCLLEVEILFRGILSALPTLLSWLGCSSLFLAPTNLLLSDNSGKKQH
ncbi:hypothetical protein MKZ38_004175 [Zalerion maritima]|uniref:Uncharacterized protein n=1 Tax=Zalerion maritima TaxID=339359 RepID=A0AAD5RN15_9PEZI|nr:hypothetical protein MKZ38_004175 [Zalerion maritima]